MHLIMYTDGMQDARSWTVTRHHVLIAGAIVSSVVILLLCALAWFVFVSPSTSTSASTSTQDETSDPKYSQNNLRLMATRLGELQAEMLELKALSRRLGSLAGVKLPEEKEQEEEVSSGQGGPLVLDYLDADELKQQIESLSEYISEYSDLLNNAEAIFLERRVKDYSRPTIWPISGVPITSRFGYRKDPIARVSAFHKGVDFGSKTGTSVKAAAGGIVIRSDYHHAYGNIVEVDHGQDMVTRYAHLSKRLVQKGQLVKLGERIAKSGNSGRSTGPHLHFEVLINRVQQNPILILKRGQKTLTRLKLKG